MRTSNTLVGVAVLLACSCAEKATESARASSSVVVSSVSAPVAVSSVADPIAVSGIAGPVAVSSVSTPVSVSSVESPVAVSGIAAPVVVSGIAAPVVVSAISTPVSVAAIQAPVTVTLDRPELDPDRIETGTERGGVAATCYWNHACRMLAEGPFVLTDIVVQPSRVYNDYDRPSVRFFAFTGDPSTSASPRWELTLGDRDDGRWRTTGSSGGGSVYTDSNAIGSRHYAITGARFAVRAGEKLYLDLSDGSTGLSTITVTWSGFRP